MFGTIIDRLIIMLEQMVADWGFLSIMQFAVVITWLLIVRLRHVQYQSSLTIALVLAILAMLVSIVSFNIAGRISEYVLLFLGIGIIQMLLEKD